TGARRLRDDVLSTTGIDTDARLHPLLIGLCAAFTDQGMAYWPMPGRDTGLLAAAEMLFRLDGFVEPPGLRGLARFFHGVSGKSGISMVEELLERWAVPIEAREELLTLELLALPGWAGLIRRLEEEPELAPYRPVPATLDDFLAVRLLLTAAACPGDPGDWDSWQRSAKDHGPSTEVQRRVEAGNLAILLERLGWSADLPDEDWNHLVATTRACDDVERRRLLHLAYERRHALAVLGPISRYRHEGRFEVPARPSAQVFFCIDEREESARRALEEAAPEVETFGAAGFFGVAVHFHGADEAHGAAFCPVVVTPQHAVLEVPRPEDADRYAERRQRRKRIAKASLAAFKGSRTLLRGTLASLVTGVPMAVGLAARVVAPGRTGRLVDQAMSRWVPEARTELTALHDGESTTHGLQQGFTIEEKADRVAGMLRAAGLVSGTARIVAILGHGSTSLNNPHESAHDCGACGGRRGGPNARLFATLANHPDVRALLPARGVEISPDTWFVGGYHDTSSDEVLLYDTDRAPATHGADLQRLRTDLERMRAGNALERARRFEAAASDRTPEKALAHVEDRARQLAEPRPEYGHATNAVCIVGRRGSTRGLFLDRRAFLVSYDAGKDPEDNSLAGLLGAAGPVCAGINLEYYFSFVDNERYGCGTKLPHNVVGLMGVMNGYRSDLRTGLPWQMVEIHEPVRLLLVVETTPERLWGAVSRSPVVTELVVNRWIRLAALDPVDGTTRMWEAGQWREVPPCADPLPVAATSPEWFVGKLDHLPIARIGGRS
ncbi:MAG: putative inorganic carbon transporter subunit DabA, partial [Armatimonadota bacterium]